MSCRAGLHCLLACSPPPSLSHSPAPPCRTSRDEPQGAQACRKQVCVSARDPDPAQNTSTPPTQASPHSVTHCSCRSSSEWRWVANRPRQREPSSRSISAPARAAPARTSVPLPSSSTCDIVGGGGRVGQEGQEGQEGGGSRQKQAQRAGASSRMCAAHSGHVCASDVPLGACLMGEGLTSTNERGVTSSRTYLPARRGGHREHGGQSKRRGMCGSVGPMPQPLQLPPALLPLCCCTIRHAPLARAGAAAAVAGCCCRCYRCCS